MMIINDYSKTVQTYLEIELNPPKKERTTSAPQGVLSTFHYQLLTL